MKGAQFGPLVGLARSKKHPIICAYGDQHLYRPPPAAAKVYKTQKRTLVSCNYRVRRYQGAQQQWLDALICTLSLCGTNTV